MILEDAEREIYDYYHFFAANAPGVAVQEEGHLAQLWAFVDQELAEEA